MIHPIVRKNMKNFLKKNKGKKFVVLDVPLFLENKLNTKKKPKRIFINIYDALWYGDTVSLTCIPPKRYPHVGGWYQERTEAAGPARKENPGARPRSAGGGGVRCVDVKLEVDCGPGMRIGNPWTESGLIFNPNRGQKQPLSLFQP